MRKKLVGLLTILTVVMVFLSCSDPLEDSVQSSNADLISLTINNGTLSPIFTSGTFSYSVDVPYTVNSIIVTGITSDNNATLSTNSGVAQSLNVGLNTITITVTAQDGVTTKSYIVTVTRDSGVTSGFSLVSSFNPVNDNITNFVDVSISGDFAYIACHDNSSDNSGLLVVNINDPENPTQVAFIQRGFTTNVEVSGNYAFINKDGNQFESFDITDPSNPVGPLDSYWYSDGNGFTINGNYGFVTDQDFGLKILDITDKTNISLIGSYSDDETIGTYGENGAVKVVGNLLYMVGKNYDLKIIDITDKENPTLLSTLKTGNSYGIDVFVVDGYAYIANSSSIGMKIIDVSNSASPTLISTYAVNDAQGVIVSGDVGYISDSGEGIIQIDLSNKAVPTKIASFDASSVGYASKFAIQGNYLFLGHKNDQMKIISK